MQVEAFSRGKDPAHPEANEDRFVVLPGRLYAAIDGVSARGGARYDGMLSGQFAANLVQRTLEGGIPGDAWTVLGHLTQTLAEAHQRLGIAEAVWLDPNPRLATTLALVLERDGRIEILLVGDSGVRINGDRIFQVTKDLDGITANLRKAAWHRIAGRIDDPLERERLSRVVTLNGTHHTSGFAAEDLAAIEAEAASACARQYPAIPEALVAGLLRGGILNEQSRHQNNPDSPLGYSCLDGFAIPTQLVRHVVLDAAEVREIELFTDGYFALGEGFGVTAWENRFAAVEREDPAKIGTYASVKGSVGGLWSDDRTYVGIRRHSVTEAQVPPRS